MFTDDDQTEKLKRHIIVVDNLHQEEGNRLTFFVWSSSLIIRMFDLYQEKGTACQL